MRQIGRRLRLSAALFLAACGETGGPTLQRLEITALSPAPGATEVETGATVAVVFNQAIDPATLTAATFQVRRGGAGRFQVATALSYDPATSTARAAAPLLPGVTYEIAVTNGLRTPAGTGLFPSRAWSFTTRAWQAVTVDTAGGGSFHDAGFSTALAVDASGRRHVSYFDGVNHHLKYATCAAGCDAAGSWQAVTVDGAGYVGLSTALAVDASGRLHVGYMDAGNSDLKYATCAAGCDAAANWHALTADTAGYVGLYTALAVDASGRLHVSYTDHVNRYLKYATCADGCDAAVNWRTTTVDATGVVEYYTALAVDASGRPHVSYFDGSNLDLKYATCEAGCEAAANWRTTTVDPVWHVGWFSALAVDASGRLHVSYLDLGFGDLRYAACAVACDVAGTWQSVAVDTAGQVGFYTALAVDASGRLHVGYRDASNADLKYATCAVRCDAAVNWQAVTVDGAGDVGVGTALAVDANGRIHVSYWDMTNQDLKYIQ